MKKFMTVLLVIAVMFTFSFSTAFAAGVSGYDKNLATSYFKIAMDDVKADGYITLLAGGYGYDIEYATIASHEAEILAAVLDYCKNEGTFTGSYAATADDIADVLNYMGSGSTFVYDVAMELVAAQYAADKAEALAILSGLDTSSFSEKEMSAAMVAADDHECETYVEHVKALIADAIDSINEATFTTDSVLGDYRTAQLTINTYFDAYRGPATTANYTKLVVEEGYMSGTTPVGLGVYGLNSAFVTEGTTLAAYKTTAVDAGAATTAANIAAKKAEIAAAYAQYLTTSGLTADEKAAAANVKKAMDFVAEEGEYAAFQTPLSQYFGNATTNAKVATAIANAEAFAARAARLAAQTDVNGVLVRDAEDVADLVTEGTMHDYVVALGLAPYVAGSYSSITTCEDEITALYAGLDAEKLAFEKAMRETFVAEIIADYEKNATYYPLELAKVKVITEEYLAKVNAVTELAKVDKYDTDYIGTITATVAAFTEGGKLADVATAAEVKLLTGVSSLKTVAQEYAALQNKYITKEANRYYGVTYGSETGNYAKLNALVEALVGNSEARTAKEIAALSADAIALVATLPTNAEVEAAGEAVEDAVDLLPATVTVAHKDVVDAAIAANKAYKALTTVNHGEKNLIDAAVTKYAYAYDNAADAQIKALDKTDKAAIKALRAELKAFAKTYSTDVLDDEVNTLDGYLGDIKAAEAKAVNAAIVAIPVTANLTEAAAAKVEAARAAYDAYVAEYTSTYDFDYNNAAKVTTDGFVADDFAYTTIVNAETILGLNDKSEEIAKAEAIAAIEGLKIKAKSSAKKGSITVKWTVDEEVEGVKYQVYKSTKAHTGYKKSITTSKTTFKNTKNLKKGTRYFYKVRAIGEVDGVTYYSDWSNKANRIAK